MPQTNQQQADVLAEHIRILVAKTPINYGNVVINMTISLGISSYKGHEPEPCKMLAGKPVQASSLVQWMALITVFLVIGWALMKPGEKPIASGDCYPALAGNRVISNTGNPNHN